MNFKEKTDKFVSAHFNILVTEISEVFEARQNGQMPCVCFT